MTVWFGDVAIPWLTSKDTSISKNVIEKNFTDEPPNVYELTPDLENGTYSVILNETVHPKEESFSEQKDAVLSMVDRHGTEFPYELGGDQGYVLVESVSTTDFPSLEVREAEIQIRLLENDVYHSAVNAVPSPTRNGDFDSQASPVESIIAFPSDFDIIGETANYSIQAEDTVLNFYTFDDKTIFEYDEDSNTQELSQRVAVCRLYNSLNDRLYSSSNIVDNGSYIDNKIVQSMYNSSASTIEYFNGSSWEAVGDVLLDFNKGYPSINTNDEVAVEFINGKESSVYRGISGVEYVFSDETSFTFSPNNTFTSVSDGDYYHQWQDGENNDIIIVRESNDGSFYTGSSEFGIQSLDQSKEYKVTVAVVPSDISVSDYARYVYNFGKRKRTFTQV